MATAVRREGKQNAGNQRKGTAIRAVPRKGMRKGTALPWRKDPLIRERVQLVWKLWAQGYGPSQILVQLKQFAEEKGVPGYEITVVYDDRKRIMELIGEADDNLRQEHIESLRLVKREAWGAFDKTPETSMNKSSLLQVIAKAEETAAKIDGSLVARVEKEIHITKDDEARVLIAVLVKRLGSEEEALSALEEIRSELEQPKLTAKVIDGK